QRFPQQITCRGRPVHRPGNDRWCGHLAHLPAAGVLNLSDSTLAEGTDKRSAYEVRINERLGEITPRSGADRAAVARPARAALAGTGHAALAGTGHAALGRSAHGSVGGNCGQPCRRVEAWLTTKRPPSSASTSGSNCCFRGYSCSTACSMTTTERCLRR